MRDQLGDPGAEGMELARSMHRLSHGSWIDGTVLERITNEARKEVQVKGATATL